jgi:hypothetical protein
MGLEGADACCDKKVTNTASRIRIAEAPRQIFQPATLRLFAAGCENSGGVAVESGRGGGGECPEDGCLTLSFLESGSACGTIN